MEEILLRGVCVVLLSLLHLKEHTVIEERDDDIMTSMQERERLLQAEGSKLEQEVYAFALKSPHCNQEVSQSHCWLTKGEEPDVHKNMPSGIVEKPHHHQTLQSEDGNILIVDDDRDTQTDEAVPLNDKVIQQETNLDYTPTMLDVNPSPDEGVQYPGQNDTKHVPSKVNETAGLNNEVSLKDIVQDVESVHEGSTKEATVPISGATHSDQKPPHLDQSETQQKTSTEGEGIAHEEHKPFFQRILHDFTQKWSQTFQTSQDVKTSQDDDPVEGYVSSTSTEESTKTMQTEYYESSENDFSWYLWKLLSLMSMLRLLRKFLHRYSKTSGSTTPIMEDEKISGTLIKTAEISLPENKVLSCFYDQSVRIPSSTSEQHCEFVEGFVGDLLEAARNISNKGTDMQIQDFFGVGSLYELWATRKRIVYDLFVPISAAKSYAFDFELWNKNDSLAILGCGRIKVVKTQNTSNGCPCSDANLDDDTLCLIHPHNEMKSIIVDAVDGPLCQENTSYLSKSQVVRWFRETIRKAWGETSHKYEFELKFRNEAAPGALRVRFRSGKVIQFNITPVVQVKGSTVYLLSYLSSHKDYSDSHWPISLSSYENALIQHFSKSLPPSSCHLQCLQILSFLLKQQNSLTEKSGITSYHLKMTLLHLLLVKVPTDWESEQLAVRIREMLMFLQQRLRAKTFHHALIGNPQVPSHIELPQEFLSAKSPNIFRDLVTDTELYLKTVQHLQEVVKNAPLLIEEYAA